MSNFLPTVEAPMVIFLPHNPPELLDRLKELRGDKPTRFEVRLARLQIAQQPDGVCLLIGTDGGGWCRMADIRAMAHTEKS